MGKHDNAEVTISDGQGHEVKTTLGNLDKLAGTLAGDKSNFEPADVFLWANRADAFKHALNMELFVFNKNLTPYSLQFGQVLEHKMLALFVYDIINSVQMGAGTGMQVRNYVEAAADDLAVLEISSEKQESRRASTVLWLIENERQDIVEFNEAEHDYKRLKGMVLRCTPKVGDEEGELKPFYVFKQFQATQAVKGGRDFVLQKDKLQEFSQDLAFKIDPSSQVLAVDNSLFIFSQSKYEALFDTKPHTIARANENGRQIDQLFKLSMPLVVPEIAIMAQTDKTATKKLAEVNPHLMSQEEVINAADEFAIELMTDDSGAIILMDVNDVKVFLDILLDNFVHGSTGIPYVAKTKKELEPAD